MEVKALATYIMLDDFIRGNVLFNFNGNIMMELPLIILVEWE